MSDRSVLVTGGAGFIGSHLCHALIKGGYGVVCLDNFDPYYGRVFKEHNIRELRKRPEFEMVEGDILDKDNLDRTFSRYKPDTIIHLAARAGVRPSLKDPALYEKVNVEGTRNIADAAARHGVAHLVFASSSSVYGVNDKVPFSEEDALLKPVSPYAVTKIAAEGMLHVFHQCSAIPVTILRFFTVFGPGQRPEMAIHKFTRMIDTGMRIPFFGDGGSRRDYTWIDDIISGLMGASFSPSGYRIFNLGGHRTVSLAELLGFIEKSLNKKAMLDRLPDQTGDVPVTCANIDKSRKYLGFEPRMGVEKGIDIFVKWYMDTGRQLHEACQGV